MTIKLLLIDGLNLIRRLHAAVANEPAEDLKRRCLGAVDKALRVHQPSHAMVIWDGGHQNSWRRELYPEYKAQRKPMPQDLADALPLLDQGFASMGVRSVKVADKEADDLIATIAHKAASKNVAVVILSTDKGFGQLHNANISQWDHFEGHWIDNALLEQKVGVPQHRLLEYWALAGDNGNGIPGVPGVGKKTALDLLSRFDSLEAVFAPDAVEGKLGEKLKTHYGQAQLSQQLVTLRRDLQLDLNLRDFQAPR